MHAFYAPAYSLIVLIDDISDQVCALKVLAIAIGKGHETLIFIYEEYNSVSGITQAHRLCNAYTCNCIPSPF